MYKSGAWFEGAWLVLKPETEQLYIALRSRCPCIYLLLARPFPRTYVLHGRRQRPRSARLSLYESIDRICSQLRRVRCGETDSTTDAPTSCVGCWWIKRTRSELIWQEPILGSDKRDTDAGSRANASAVRRQRPRSFSFKPNKTVQSDRHQAGTLPTLRVTYCNRTVCHWLSPICQQTAAHICKD